MSEYRVPPSVEGTIADLRKRIQALEASQGVRTYTVATRPPASQVSASVIIFVSDAAAGSKFQGWDGSSWVSLG